MMNGLTFNGKHSYKDFGIVLSSKSIQPPSKKKIKIDVPYMNGSYDFSTFGSNGEINYTERSIQVIFSFPTKSKEQLHILYSKVLEWLVDVSKSQLIFDDIADYYFMAEVENAPSFEEMIRFGKLAVIFICEPFKTSIDFVGADIWDTFNFETDIVQDVEFDIVENKVISILNQGRATIPVINCSSTMSIIFNSKTYNLTTGDNKLYDFKLANGDNDVTINGTGHVKFEFRKVSL